MNRRGKRPWARGQYNELMRRSRGPKILLIILALTVAAVGPILVSGYGNLGRAHKELAAAEYVAASRHYESAARQLFWRGDLWESAGVAAHAGGDMTRAAMLLGTAVQHAPVSARGWDALGSALWSLGDHTSAVAAWEAGSRAHPEDAHLLDRLSSALHEQGDYAAESAVLKRRLGLGDDTQSHYSLGLLLLASDPAAAREHLLAIAADPKFGPAATSMLSALDEASRLDDQAGRSIVLGRGLGLVDEWGLAAQEFERAAQASPANAEAWAWLGEARQHSGQDAMPDLDRALSINPNDAVVRSLRGLYWKRQGDNTRALAEFLAAAELQPDNPSLQSSLGETYAANGDLVAALGAYQSAAGLAPEDPTYWRLLALFCADYGVQVADIGLPAAQKAAELAPDDPQVRDALGWSYAQAGFPYTAQHILLELARSSPSFAPAHLHLGETYLRTGDFVAAREQFEAARQLDPAGPVGGTAARFLQQYFP